MDIKISTNQKFDVVESLDISSTLVLFAVVAKGAKLRPNLNNPIGGFTSEYNISGWCVINSG